MLFIGHIARLYPLQSNPHNTVLPSKVAPSRVFTSL
jgi:hypothetical protein